MRNSELDPTNQTCRLPKITHARELTAYTNSVAAQLIDTA